jgi:hypothetical protein
VLLAIGAEYSRLPKSASWIASTFSLVSVKPSGSDRAAQLMDLLGLSEDELCRILDVDALTLLSGQLDHRPELPILLDLLEEAAERARPGVLRSWVRSSGPHGKPIDALTRRDFVAFEDALADLSDRGFILRGGG